MPNLLALGQKKKFVDDFERHLTTEKFTELSYELVHYPPYAPDLSLTEYYL